MLSEDERGLADRRRSPAYVLFASTFARDFYAVVPTHTEIPSLLLGPGWRFVRILKGSNTCPASLRRKSVSNAISRDGYYLFTGQEFSPVTQHGRTPSAQLMPRQQFDLNQE
jgi:hypothetical protein